MSENLDSMPRSRKLVSGLLSKSIRAIQLSEASDEGVDFLASIVEHQESTNLDETIGLTKSDSDAPVVLDGTLNYRNGESSRGLPTWRQGRVVFDMKNGGTLACFDRSPGDASPRKLSKRGLPSTKMSTRVIDCELDSAVIYLPTHVNWIAKDIKNNAHNFMIEIWSEQDEPEPLLNGDFHPITGPQQHEQPSMATKLGDVGMADRVKLELPKGFGAEREHRRENGQPQVVFFSCSRSNEKVFWLHAFDEIGRFSRDLHHRRGLKSFIPKMRRTPVKSRVRSHMAELFASQRELLRAHLSRDENDQETEGLLNDDPDTCIRKRETRGGAHHKEYIVHPRYAYPNRWMTDRELHAEVIKPSEKFHDLRRSDASTREIGNLKFEILECSGLPDLDLASKTDAVAYMVCGS